MHDCLLEVHLLYLLIEDPLIHLLISLVDYLDVFLVLRVPLRVMPKVESLGLLDFPAHPLAEVSVVDLPLLLVVLIYDQLGQVFEIEFLVLAAKEAENVVHRYETIIVTVKVQESFSHTDPVVCKLILNELFQPIEAGCHRFMVLCSRNRSLVSFLGGSLMV